MSGLDISDFSSLPKLQENAKTEFEAFDAFHSAAQRSDGLIPSKYRELIALALTTQSLPNASRYMLTIVNDWQYVPSGADRMKFYADFANLPISFVDEARSAQNEGVKLLTPSGPSGFTALRPYFSERSLRNQYNRRVKRLIKQGALPGDVELNLSEDGATCSLLEVMGRKREVYCSSKDADCSSEVAELIYETFALVECDTFINLYAPEGLEANYVYGELLYCEGELAEAIKVFEHALTV